jgi:hypothetical protein
MSSQKRKVNKLDPANIQQVADQITKAWPYSGVKTAFYINDPEPLKLTDSKTFRENFAGAVGEVRADSVNLRIYRDADEGEHDFDVDEIRGANKVLVTQPAKTQIEDHHLTGTLPVDLMNRNNLSVEAVSDGRGGMRLNIRPDGTVPAFINFEPDGVGGCRFPE